MATTTPNYGWTVPTSTDLVKDGATAIETLGDAVDATVFANANAAINKTIVDAKGDLIAATASDTVTRLASSAVNGQVLTVDTTTATGLKWATPSSGATVWTTRLASMAGPRGVYSIAYNGSNLYVAAGTQGALYSSPDGITWTSRTSGFGANNINKVIYANSLWIAVGANGTITTSSDGVTWTARTSNMSTNAINDIIYAAGNFVAVGAGGGATNTGGITYSTDGVTWTRKSQTPTIGTTYNCITYNGTNFLVGAGLSTNNYLYATTPSGTWTAAASYAQQILWMAYDGTRTIWATAGFILFTTGTTLSSWTAYGSVALVTSYPQPMNYYYNGKIYQSAAGYYYSWSTTPDANNYPTSINQIDLSPVNTLNDAGLVSTNCAIWAGAAGMIIGAIDNGTIYTSF